MELQQIEAEINAKINSLWVFPTFVGFHQKACKATKSNAEILIKYDIQTGKFLTTIQKSKNEL